MQTLHSRGQSLEYLIMCWSKQCGPLVHLCCLSMISKSGGNSLICLDLLWTRTRHTIRAIEESQQRRPRMWARCAPVAPVNSYACQHNLLQVGKHTTTREPCFRELPFMLVYAKTFADIADSENWFTRSSNSRVSSISSVCKPCHTCIKYSENQHLVSHVDQFRQYLSNILMNITTVTGGIPGVTAHRHLPRSAILASQYVLSDEEENRPVEANYGPWCILRSRNRCDRSLRQ